MSQKARGHQPGLLADLKSRTTARNERTLFLAPVDPEKGLEQDAAWTPLLAE
jgi:hypothetical protein